MTEFEQIIANLNNEQTDLKEVQVCHETLKNYQCTSELDPTGGPKKLRMIAWDNL